MNRMDEKQQYDSYNWKNSCHNRRFDDNHDRRYRKYNQYSSSYRDDQIYYGNKNKHSNQHSQKHQQSNPKTYTCYSSSSSIPPLMATKTVNPPTLITAIPHERESWIRSVKKTKINESTEQKTQYLETMLRMPQQKSAVNSATFDRIRFANQDDHLNGNSSHLISNADNYDQTNTVDRILFGHPVQTANGNSNNSQLLPTPPPSVADGESTSKTRSEKIPFSGFLIDNYDEVQPTYTFSLSSHFADPIPSIIEDTVQQNQSNSNEQCSILLNELNVADAEQKKLLQRQKQSHRKIQKKKNTNSKKKQLVESETLSIANSNEKESDWVIEYDVIQTNPISKINDMIQKVSTTMTDEDKVAQVNFILQTIKKQQTELKQLKQHVMSILGEEQSHNATSTTRDDSDINRNLLITFLNQPTTSGCWLCSGKTYTETAIQCDDIN